MSWGIKIALLYCGFVVLILSMVMCTMTYKVDLVSPDYYEQELKFQDKLNGLRNTDSLHLHFKTETDRHKISLVYPAQWKGQPVEGKILFYRPSDSALDLSFMASQGTQGQQVFASDRFRLGAYKMLCDFKVGGRKFCYEESIFLK